MHSEKEGRGLQIKSALTVSQSPCGGHKKVHIVQWGLSVHMRPVPPHYQW